MTRLFQCRERLEADFHMFPNSSWLNLPKNKFQCRERLEADFHQWHPRVVDLRTGKLVSVPRTA